MKTCLQQLHVLLNGFFPQEVIMCLWLFVINVVVVVVVVVVVAVVVVVIWLASHSIVLSCIGDGVA